MGVRVSKPTDKTKAMDAGPDSVKKRSQDGLNMGRKLQSPDTDVELSKAVDKTRPMDPGPDSVKTRKEALLNMVHKFRSPDTEIHTTRKDTARHFIPETDSSDEAYYQATFGNISDQASRSPEDRISKARPFNPDSDSSEEADIPDSDETQPKTGLPHPIQETRPPAK